MSIDLQNEWIGVLLAKLGIALVIFAPMTLALGIILMHRVAGPIYRFEQFLAAVARGEHEHDCKIRDGDELVEMCDLLNRFTAPIRNGTVDLEPFRASMAGEAPTELAADTDTETDEATVEPAVEVEAV